MLSRLRPEGPWRSYLLLAIAVPLLIAVSNLLLDRFPERVRIDGNSTRLTIFADQQTLVAPLPQPLRALRFPTLDPERREYPIDGSDSTNNFTYDPAYFAQHAAAPYFRFQAWLRDASTYSRWQDLLIRDGQGQVVSMQPRPAPDSETPLPPSFTLTVDLHRVETTRSLDFIGASGGLTSLIIDRNDKQIAIDQSATATDNGQQIARTYFPLDPVPIAAENVAMLLRTAAVGLALLALLIPIAALLPALPLPGVSDRLVRIALPAALGVGLAAMIFAATALFDRAPHILDGISYYFQAKILASGHLSVAAPAIPDAFPTPFTVIHAGRWFSMYVQGTSFVLALGFLAHLPWLVEPVMGVGAIVLTYAMVRRQYGVTTALVAAVLMASSPFLQLQAGAFMSHVPTMFYGTCLIYALTRYAGQPARRWVLLGAAAVGAILLTRELSFLLYGAIGAATFLLIWRRCTPTRAILPDLLLAAGCLAGFTLVYLAWNTALTGSPTLLPRTLFSATENRYGFGLGVGFYGRHTPAGGLVNADEQLTALVIELFGWPFSVALAIVLLPFLLRRTRPWDFLYGAIALSFVGAYVGLYYHGITYGPRYYFDGFVAFVILSARGFAVLMATVTEALTRFGRRDAVRRGRLATAGLGVALLACNAIFFEPRQVQLYSPLSGRPGAGGLVLGSSIQHDLTGRTMDLSNAVVATPDGIQYRDLFGPMNCPDRRCRTVFVYLPPGPAGDRIHALFPGRTWYTTPVRDGTITFLPEAVAPPSPVGVAPAVTWTVAPAYLLLHLSFDGSAVGSGGQEPAGGRFVPAPGRDGGGALVTGINALTYQHIPVDPRHGALGIWVQPLWDGNDQQSHVFVDIGTPAAGIRLSKDGANNLRFQIWSPAGESDLAYGVAGWRRGQWHHAGGIWTPDGHMELLTDGTLVGQRPATLLPTVADTIFVGMHADGTLNCTCVLDDVSVSKGPVTVK
ncbi:MAG: LamG-like jellyroll fold domain-containing protein [Chloroflexota bacterium]